MMKASHVKKHLETIGLPEVRAAYVFQTQPVTIKRWERFGTDGCNAILLRLLASGKITIQDVEQAHD